MAVLTIIIVTLFSKRYLSRFMWLAVLTTKTFGSLPREFSLLWVWEARNWLGHGK